MLSMKLSNTTDIQIIYLGPIEICLNKYTPLNFLPSINIHAGNLHLTGTIQRCNTEMKMQNLMASLKSID